MFHAVTYSTSYLFTFPTLIKDLDAWNASVAYAKSTIPDAAYRKAYFCDACVYGSGTSRSIDIVPDLWQAADLFWPQLMSMPKMSFTDFWQWLAKKKYDKHSNLAHKGKKIFPQFGLLISYLLMVDYAYAGLVSPPSMAELANIVKHINAGGVHGLQLLGLLDMASGSTLSNNSIQKAFEDFYHFLDSSLTLEEKMDTGFDIFVVEHLLCKITCLQSHIFG